jgi:hypothetical protein
MELNLVGKRVAQVRLATRHEMKKCGWEGQNLPMVFVLDGGYVFLPSKNDELNAPGQTVILDSLSGELSTLA